MSEESRHDLEFYRTRIEDALAHETPFPGMRPAVLREAIGYALGTGGKRLRPVICLAVAEATGGSWEDALGPALAIEVLHNYTLVHDDLPAMDNDRERRGQPSVWAKFGEANAILAGDAMLAWAFRLASRAPRRIAEIIDTLGERGVGVVCGQVEDVARMAGPDAAMRPDDDFIYRHKTADLFIAAARMGALAAGADDVQVEAAGEFALRLGLAFQYEDDLLDGDGLYSPERTRQLVREMSDVASIALKRLSGDTSFLADLVHRLADRTV